MNAPPPPAPARQRGALLIMFALLLVSLLAFIGLALDVAQVYNRQTELQNLADAAALAAARSLTGTGDGVADAAAQARAVAVTHRVAYNKPVNWDDRALSFGAGADGPWVDLGAAQAAPQALHYARVDTGVLAASAQAAPYGQVATVFMHVLDPDTPHVTTAAHAVARRSAIEVTPLAVCALDPLPAGERLHAGVPLIRELVQHGFRLGVGYNLLNLNPQVGATTAEYFLLNPLGGLDGDGVPGHAADAALAPFMCSGSVQLPRLVQRSVALRRPSAFGLAEQLNSRFGVYGAGAAACLQAAAPPDVNVAQYTGAPLNWMTPAPSGTHAAASSAPGEALYTVADRAPGVPAPSAASYGPLWAYGPARLSAAPHAAIAKADWSRLYPATGGAPAVNANYLASPPYHRSGGVQFAPPPSQPARSGRRLLHIPLLACPVPAGADTQATVLAIGRFLLTSAASGSQVSAEFAGLLDEAALPASAELVR